MDLIELSRVGTEFHRHPWEQARARAVGYFLKNRKPAPQNVLDVGSGDAFIASTVAQQFPNARVTALDINYTQDVLEKIKAPSNLHLVSSLQQVRADVKTDVVLLMDVLEHVENPGEMLQQVKSLNVDANTDIFITVPAYQSLFTQHDVVLGHYKRYDVNSLRALAEANGFSVQQSGYFFHSLLPVRACQKIIRTKITEDGLHNWRGNAFTTSLLTSVFNTEFKISWYLSRFGIHLPGLTCFCLCRPLPS